MIRVAFLDLSDFFLSLLPPFNPTSILFCKIRDFFFWLAWLACKALRGLRAEREERKDILDITPLMACMMDPMVAFSFVWTDRWLHRYIAVLIVR